VKSGDFETRGGAFAAQPRWNDPISKSQSPPPTKFLDLPIENENGYGSRLSFLPSAFWGRCGSLCSRVEPNRALGVEILT
jgi:hypothetical protein